MPHTKAAVDAADAADEMVRKAIAALEAAHEAFRLAREAVLEAQHLARCCAALVRHEGRSLEVEPQPCTPSSP